MKLLFVGLVSVLAMEACRTRPVSGIVDGAAAGTGTANPMPMITETVGAPRPGSLVMSKSSYSGKYASPARNSCVPVQGRPLSALHRVVSLKAVPRRVLTNDAGDHVVLDYGERYEVRTPDGASVSGSRVNDPDLLMLPKSLLVDGGEYDFAGGAGVALLNIGVNVGDTVWAVEVGEKTATYIVQQIPKHYASTVPLPGDPTVGARVWNQTPTKLVVDSVVFYVSHAHGTSVWTKEFEGGGCGAVGTDRFIAVATTDQRFFAYDANAPAGPAGIAPPPLATARLAFVPYDISIVEGGVAVLSGGKGSSTVHMLARDGRELWQATVPFSVDTPPIDAGGGRVYLVGDGFAAADHGKILWSQKSTGHTYATSLADGSALVAIGPELRVVSRDGAVLRRLRVPEGDALVTPPAVTADGTVWLATAKALYVAR
jgi:hypothetical protein